MDKGFFIMVCYFIQRFDGFAQQFNRIEGFDLYWSELLGKVLEDEDQRFKGFFFQKRLCVSIYDAQIINNLETFET